MNSQLIIFDCDGVLVDSEMISARVFAEIIGQVGIHMTPMEAFKQFKGGSMGASLAYVESVLGGPAPIDIEAEYRKKSFDAYQQEMIAVEGITEILERLSVPSCVASNGPRNKILLNLELTRLSRFFPEESIFSAYDFNRWKPDPTMFLAAAEHHQCDPEKCLVVGDSKADIMAANAAGMSVVGYAPLGDYEDFGNHGAKVISRMKQLEELLFND